MTEFWVRDPLRCIQECATLMVPNIVWEGRLLDQKAIDAQAQLEMHYPTSFDYRILVIRHDGTQELRRGYSPDAPAAVYQTWSYDTESLDDLEDMLDNDPGEDMALCTDPSISVKKRPVLGQEHRVVITRWPDPTMTLGRTFLRALARYQTDFPEVIIHLWGTNSFRSLYGMGLASGDFDPGKDASFKLVYLPNGKRVQYERAQEYAQWVRLLGFSQSELAKVNKRNEFNIKSAMWAAQYFETDIKFKTKETRGKPDPVDPNNPHHMPATTVNVMASRIKASEGDKITCDTCSLHAACKYFRDGAVCSLPDTDTAKLAGYFATRSSDVIIAGLGKIMGMQAERFERGTEDEEYQDELNPAVTRLGHVLMQDGATLAKLVDPTLAAAGAARVQAFYGGQHIHGGGANELVANIVRELEGKGISRDDITDEMVNEHIQQQHQQAIEAASHEQLISPS